MIKTKLNYSFIQRLTELPYINHIYLYGSRARGDHRPRSDLDLAIECPQASNQDWQHILEIVEDADTLLNIDVLRYDQLQEGLLKENIDRDKKIIMYR